MSQLELGPRDLDHCRSLMRRGSKTFSLAARLLPREVRDATTAFYAFCRVSDDCVDACQGDPRASVEALVDRVDAVFGSAPLADPVDRGLRAVVKGFDLPRATIDALLEGYAWDAEGRTYRSFDEVEAYATRVAGSVGVVMAYFMGARSERALARACDLGIAMQLTNLARDVGEDARRGRIYLPSEWLDEVGLAPSQLLSAAGGGRSRSVDRRVRVLVAKLLDAAEAYYVRADFGIELLVPRCRAAIRAARVIYADIGRSIRRVDGGLLEQRAVVGLGRKIWLLVGALFPPRLDERRDVGVAASAVPLLEACARYEVTCRMR